MTYAEAALVAIGGAILGGLVGKLVGGTVLMIVFAVIAGVSGGFSGYYRIYRWNRWTGWAGFVLDSTWAMVGTTLAVLIHIANVAGIRGKATHSEACSLRQNRHIYFGGLYLKKGFVFNQGNVITNASERPKFLKEHEELHIWQNRWFGPLFQLTYIVVAIVGFFVAAGYWLVHRSEKFVSLLETATYYDNPFEYWAYVNNDRWPHPDAHPALRWPWPAERPPGADAAHLAEQNNGAKCEPPS